MMMVIRIKQQATFEVQFIKKLSNTEAELKKALLIKKRLASLAKWLNVRLKTKWLWI